MGAGELLIPNAVSVSKFAKKPISENGELRNHGICGENK
jgi:hypothetical protein